MTSASEETRVTDVADITSFLNLCEGAATLFGHDGSDIAIAVRTIEGFVLKNGRVWTSAPRPRDIRKMRAKACYRNAMHVLAGRDDLEYVEGYALSANGVLPVMHGWLVRDDGTVIDPTWDDCETAAYYGLVIPTPLLAAMVMETRATGFLASDYAVGHPCRRLGRLPTVMELRQFAEELREDHRRLTRR